MKASFVIVNYNRKDDVLLTIRNTLNLIGGDLVDYEIVLVDNASSDGSADAVRDAFPGVLLIENPVNTGAPAWNLGFKKASGDYFIIIDDDSHIEYGLTEGLGYMENHPEVGVLALNVVTGPYTSDMWEWKDGQETIGFIGCGAILRKKTFDEIGGYADWMFLYVNEWEYGIRCLQAGYQVKFFENSKVIHRASKSHRSSKRLRVFVTKHELGIVYKYFSSHRLKYLFRIALNSLKGIRHLEFREPWYNLIGMFEFLKLRKKLTYTPVDPGVQQFFADTFPVTKRPAFGFLTKGVSRIFKR